MADIADDLNYDYNYNMFLAKTLLSNLETHGDRQRAIKWMHKLATCNRTLDEMRLRNDFMYFLVINVQNGVLEEPFKENPPAGALPAIAHLLPSGADAARDLAADMAGGPEPAGARSHVYARSPDGGAFLAAQPVPRCGAFCYLAVICKPQQ